MKTTYQIDPAHSAAHFTVRHMMITNVRGAFCGMTGSMTYDPATRALSAVEATIDVNSLNSNNSERDAHLKNADFFDVAKYPTITFMSTTVTQDGAAGIRVKGNLTLHGVTKEVTLNVDGPSSEGKDPWGKTRVGASGTARIKRSDFGLTWNAPLEMGGVLVGDEVRIDLELSFIKG